jgi:hypothetical protein
MCVDCVKGNVRPSVREDKLFLLYSLFCVALLFVVLRH